MAVFAVELPNTEYQSCQEHFATHIETKAQSAIQGLAFKGELQQSDQWGCRYRV